MLRPEDRPFEVANAPATILNAASLSGAVDLGGLHLAALLMPAAWTAAVVTLQTSFDGSNFVDVYDSTGTEVSITVAAIRLVMLDMTKTIALGQWVKVRSGTGGAPVAQGADRVVTLIPRSF